MKHLYGWCNIFYDRSLIICIFQNLWFGAPQKCYRSPNVFEICCPGYPFWSYLFLYNNYTNGKEGCDQFIQVFELQVFELVGILSMLYRI